MLLSFCCLKYGKGSDISVLSSNLHQIRTKDLEQQLEEAQGVKEDLRHSLMELQLHSERLSQSLIRERQEQELLIDR